MRRFDETMKTGYEVTPALESELTGWCEKLGLASAGESLADIVKKL